MSFDFQIKADPSQAIAASKQLEDRLHGIETKATATGRAVDGAFKTQAFRDASGRFLATSVSVSSLRTGVQNAAVASEVYNARLRASVVHSQQLAQQTSALEKGFAQLAEQLQREKDMLDTIHGPALRHQQDLMTLDALYRRGSISARELVEQQRKLMVGRFGSGGPAGIAPAFTNDAAASAGRNPFGGGAFAGAGASVSSLAAPVAVAAATIKVAELADDYQALQNRLRGVSDGEDQVAAAMLRAHDIAGTTYQSTATVVEAYASMKNATEDIGLTSAQTFVLVENLGKAVRAGGRDGATSAAGMMQFTQALQSGRLGGDEFRSVMENLPGVVEVLTKGLGKTKAELRLMAEQGLITDKVLVKLFLESNAGLDSVNNRLTKMRPTMSQGWQGLKNDVTGWVGEAFQWADDKFNAANIATLEYWRGEAERVNKAIAELTATERARWLSMGQGTEQERVAAGVVVDAIDLEVRSLELLDNKSVDVVLRLIRLKAQHNEAAKEMATAKAAADKFAKSLQDLLKFGDAAAPSVTKGMDTIAAGIEATNQVVGNWTSSLRGATGELSREGKLLKEIEGPLKEYTANTASLEGLLERGRITASQYDAQLRKLIDTYAGSEIRQLLDFSTKPVQMISTAKGNVPRASFEADQRTTRESDAKVDEIFTDTSWQAQAVPQFQAINAEVNAMGDAAGRVLNVLSQNNEQTTLWRLKMESLGETFDERVVRGVEGGLNKIWADVSDVSGQVESMMVGAFGKIEDSIVGMVTTGKFEWKGMVDQMLQDLTRLALRQLIMSGLNATGIMPALSFGGAHATGGSYTVGGSGGSDSQPVLFHLTPGERVDFTPKGESPGGGGSTSNTTIIQFDKRDLLPFLNTPDGKRELHSFVRSNPAMIRSLIGN